MKSSSKLRLTLSLALMAALTAVRAQDAGVRGTVTGTGGAALQGVVVVVEGTTTGTATDAQGRYSILAPADSKLVFSMLGYNPAIEAVGNRSTIDVAMTEATRELDEVVVIGYGTVRKQDLTGAVATVAAKDIKNYPASNIQDLLVGRAAGVEATASSGKPGDVASVRIRGIGSVNTTAPLYVVDGVPLNQGVNVDPRSIESMQILKDASATAIYGSRGSNGVILITTKKGKAGQVNVGFDAYIGFTQMNIKYPQASSSQLYDFYLESNRNDGTTPDPLVANQFNKGYNTDWVDLATRTGFNQNYSLSVSGGSEKFRSSLHVGYTDEKGAMKKNDLNRITLRNTNEYEPAKWLKVGNTLGVGYYKINNSLATLDVLLSADPFTPPVSPLADPAGTNYFYDKYAPTEFSYNTNPLSLLSQSNGWKGEFNPFGSLYADVELYDGLHFKSQAAFEKKNYEEELFEPYYHLVPSADDVGYNSQKYRDVNKFSKASAETLYINLEQTLRYEKMFGKHSVNAVVGLTWEKWNDSNLSGSRTGMPNNDPVFWTIDAGTAGDLAGGGKNEQAMVSYLGRVNYSYDGRYMATVSFRTDGWSEFPAGNRWGYFPSFSLGWDVSREKFFEKINRNRLFSQFKLRAGWGQTGNKSAASRNQTVSLMGTSRGVNYAFGVDKTSDPLIGYLPITRGNTILKWETGEQYNIGLDMGMLSGALNVSLDVYSKYTHDMILTVDLPIYAQYPSNPKYNMGGMRNDGIDLSVAYNGHAGEFTYGAAANLTAYKSKVTSLGGNPEYWDKDVVSRSVPGHEFGGFYMLQYLGIFQTQKEIDKYIDKDGRMIQPLAKPGDFKFADLDGDGEITDKDRTYHGTPQVGASFGLNLTAAWKGLDLTVFMNGVVGNQIFNYPKAFYGKLQKNNILQDLYNNSWRKEGDMSKYPRVSGIDLNNNYRYSSWYLENGSYLKIRNIQLGYTLPDRLLKKLKVVKNLRVYVSGQNLFTLTNYTGFDPEVGFNGIEDPKRYIPPRMYVAGVNINF